MSAPIRVLLLGGTGYIGGSVLDTLQTKYPALAKQFAFTLVVRDQGKADQLQQKYPEAKLKIVLTNHADTAKISELAAESDVVLNLADADDLPLAKAINEGLAKRVKAGGARQPILFHNSGTSVFSDSKEDDGSYTTKHTYSDAAPEDFWSLPESAPHHKIDLEAVKAQDIGVNTLIVIPCTIVGKGTGLNKMSVQVPALIAAALLRKDGAQAGTYGKGANEWPYIHVLDLAEAYVLLLSKATGFDLQGNTVSELVPSLTYGRQGTVYPATGHYVHKELAQLIGKTLHRVAPDVVKTIEVRPFDQAIIDEWLYGPHVGMVFGGSVRVGCDKLPKLGWKPTHPGLETTVEEDATYQLDRLRSGKLTAAKVSLTQSAK